MESRRIASWWASACCIAACCVSHSRVLPSMSVNRNVTVPLGRKRSARGVRGMGHSQLKQRAQHSRQVLDHLDRRRPLSPARQRQHLSLAQVTRLLLTQPLARASVVEQDHDFGVERKRANVEVGGSDPRDLIIDGDVFRVQETLAVAADAYALAQNLVVVWRRAEDN